LPRESLLHHTLYPRPIPFDGLPAKEGQAHPLSYSRTDEQEAAFMRMRGFEAQGLQGQESQSEPKDIKKKSALRGLSVLPGYTTTPVSPPIETR
jgi:hypothetical protein